MTSSTGSDRGARLGLPADGPGSSAGFAPRAGAFAIDVLLSGLVTGLFTVPDFPGNWSLLTFFAVYALTSALFGQTPGMRLVGIGLIRVDAAPSEDGTPPRMDLYRSVVRTVLLMLVVPAVIWDRDGRGLHDKLSGAAVVRAR